MSEQRVILECGSGNDLYGQDYTKAACRAVQDALHHSSILLFKSLGFDHREMRVQVTIGVQRPERVDTAVVAAELPQGYAEVRVVLADSTCPIRNWASPTSSRLRRSRPSCRSMPGTGG